MLSLSFYAARNRLLSWTLFPRTLLCSRSFAIRWPIPGNAISERSNSTLPGAILLAVSALKSSNFLDRLLHSQRWNHH